MVKFKSNPRRQPHAGSGRSDGALRRWELQRDICERHANISNRERVCASDPAKRSWWSVGCDPIAPILVQVDVDWRSAPRAVGYEVRWDRALRNCEHRSSGCGDERPDGVFQIAARNAQAKSNVILQDLTPLVTPLVTEKSSPSVSLCLAHELQATRV